MLLLAKTLRSHRKVRKQIDVLDAVNPIIKFKFNEIDFDFCLALLPKNQIFVSKHVYTNNSMRNIFGEERLDKKSYYSLLGPRDWYYLKYIASDLCKIGNQTIRKFNEYIVKWAKNRLIYSGVLGYFAGFALRVLTYYIVLISRDKCNVGDLVRYFFDEMNSFQWKKYIFDMKASHLQKIDDWVGDRVLFYNRNYTLFIFTPTRKQTLRNMTKSTFEIALDEMRRGANLSKGIPNDGIFLDMLLEERKFDFEKMYLISVTQNEESDWVGFVTSRLIKLCTRFENLCVSGKLQCLIYPYKLCHPDQKLPRFYCIGVKMESEEEMPDFKMFRKEFREFSEEMKEWKFYQDGMGLMFRPIQQKQFKEFQKAKR